MTTVKLPVDKGFYICYRKGSGRTLAHCKRFETREQAQRVIDRNEWADAMQAVEVEK